MSKIDTINKYRDEFLATCSPEREAKFNSKSIDNQYASIINWRRRNRLKGELMGEDTKKVTVNAILSTLRDLSKKLLEIQVISEAEKNRLLKETAVFQTNVENHSDNLKKKEIERLERQAKRINARINRLRNQ